jgi:hypothetical protein
MRQLALAAGAVCALVGVATPVVAQGTTMPGQVVGTGYSLSPVGSQLPKAAPSVGTPIGSPFGSAAMRPYDPSRPYDVFKGTNIDPRNVAAPVVGFGDQSAISKFYDKLKAVVGIAPSGPPSMAAVPGYTPGIGRRNRERAEKRLWRPD